jgi:hypothetical protein
MASILQKPESQTGGPIAAVLRRSCDPSVCCPQISLREVIAFEQQRQAARLSDGIGRTVAKVEPGGMAALATQQEGVSSLLRQLCILCHDLYRDPAISASSSSQDAASPARDQASTMLDSSRLTDDIRCGGSDNLQETGCFLFAA